MNLFTILIQSATELYYLFLSVSQGNTFPKRLSDKEERECFERLKAGDISARAKLIEHNLRLVAHIGKKYNVGRSDEEDMLSIGTIGLIKAVDTYNSEKGSKFSSYASRCIENECLMSLRAQKKQQQDVSMSEPIDTDKHGNELTLIDIIACEDTIADDLDTKLKCEHLRSAVSVLSARELKIIQMRYGLGNTKPLTQKEIAEKLGISRSYVSRIEKKAIEKLRERF